MSQHTEFSVYDPATGEVIRTGSVLLAADAPAQALHAAEKVLVGVQCDPIEDRVVEVAGKPQRQKRAPADIAARRPVPAEPAPQDIDLLIEVLKDKGVMVSKADLAAARGRLKPAKGAV